MEQKNIKLRSQQSSPFTIEEMDANLKELDDRTKHSDPEYNSIALLGEKLKQLDAAGVKYGEGTVADALNTLLYVAPAINSFSNNAGSPVRMGTTITSLTFNWSLNKAVVSQSINNGIGSIDPAARTKTATVSINSNTSFTLTVSDGTTTRTANTSVNFLNDRYWGTSAETALNNAQILALNNELSGSRGKTFTINGNGRYIYYIWPKRLGTAGVKVNGLDFTAVTVSEQDVTNAAGYTERYYVLRTDTIQNGTLNIQIT